MSQSTNDVIPTAIHLGALLLLRELLPALESLEDTFAAKERELNGVLKSARTHLQDAVPIRLGQEFGAYARNMKRHRRDIEQTMEGLRQLGIGGTAAGTGLNAHPEYRKRMVDTLSGELGETLSMAEDYFEAMQSMAPSVAASGALRNLAQDLIRIANDLRLLGSGPKTGLFEIRLPAVQPGSSIMPGKVNPSIAEMVDMVGFQVLGCDLTVTLAAQAGQLDLNVMMPVIAYNLFHSIEILTSSIRVLAEKTVAGIVANEERCREYAEGSMSIVTVLNPHIGYSMAAEVAKEYLASGKSIREILLERKLFTPEELDAIFDLRKMTEPGIH
jgi:aspartate ammonia-lyase